jgi:hypothetical protein
VHAFQLAESRGLSRKFLKRNLLPLLEDALEFHRLGHRHDCVVGERLERSMEAIEKEMERLAQWVE